MTNQAELDHTRRLADKKRSTEDRRRRMKEMHVQLQDILFEFNGLESNIPINHGYWDILNQYKLMSKDDDDVRVWESKQV